MRREQYKDQGRYLDEDIQDQGKRLLWKCDNSPKRCHAGIPDLTFPVAQEEILLSRFDGHKYLRQQKFAEPRLGDLQP